MSPRGLPASLEAQRFLIRARQYRDPANKLADKDGFEPNWPKYFLVTHAIELAITAYLVFEKGLGRPRTRGGGTKPDDHDLMGLYKQAVRRGLKKQRARDEGIAAPQRIAQNSLRTLSQD